jgi:hypothetical protein
MEVLKVDSNYTAHTTGWTNIDYGNSEFVFTVDIPAGHSGGSVYVVAIDTLDMSTVFAKTATVTATNTIDVRVPLKYDADYKVQVFTGTSLIQSNMFFEDYFEVRRPYVNPNTKGTTATEIATYKENEHLARAIIDSIVTDGFYYKRHLINTLGLGNDYLAVWDNLKRVVKLYENNVLIFKDEDNIEITDYWDVDPTSNTNVGFITTKQLDYTVGDTVKITGSTNMDGTYLLQELLEDSGTYGFRINRTVTTAEANATTAFGYVKKVWALEYEFIPDQTAIVLKYTGELNRYESTPNNFPTASSDYIGMLYGSRGFIAGYDYTIIGEDGYIMVPSDIKKATEMIVEDIECGKLDYYKRYINGYNTDQFNVKFDKAVFEGTGNILVDKILSKYMKTITHPGVL